MRAAPILTVSASTSILMVRELLGSALLYTV